MHKEYNVLLHMMVININKNAKNIYNINIQYQLKME